jgi:hypothetical protein
VVVGDDCVGRRPGNQPAGARVPSIELGLDQQVSHRVLGSLKSSLTHMAGHILTAVGPADDLGNGERFSRSVSDSVDDVAVAHGAAPVHFDDGFVACDGEGPHIAMPVGTFAGVGPALGAIGAGHSDVVALGEGETLEVDTDERSPRGDYPVSPHDRAFVPSQRIRMRGLGMVRLCYTHLEWALSPGGWSSQCDKHQEQDKGKC